MTSFQFCSFNLVAVFRLSCLILGGTAGRRHVAVDGRLPISNSPGPTTYQVKKLPFYTEGASFFPQPTRYPSNSGCPIRTGTGRGPVTMGALPALPGPNPPPGCTRLCAHSLPGPTCPQGPSAKSDPRRKPLRPPPISTRRCSALGAGRRLPTHLSGQCPGPGAPHFPVCPGPTAPLLAPAARSPRAWILEFLLMGREGLLSTQHL